MKTVGDFKAAGLVFIDGDRLDFHDGYRGECSKSVLDLINDGSCTYPAGVVDFAWRANTGVKPEFVGNIEISTPEGDLVIKESLIDCYDWGKTGRNGIDKWRPLLDQTEKKPSARQLAPHITDGKKAMARMRDDEAFLNNLLATNISKQSAQPKKSAYDVDAHVSGEKLAIDQLKYDAEKFPGIVQVNDDTVKPVFTQEMADAGEFPPVGSVFLNETIEVECIAIHNGRVITVSDSVYYSLPRDKCHPIKILTPKQKAVSEALKLFTDGEHVGNAVSKLYDLWCK